MALQLLEQHNIKASLWDVPVTDCTPMGAGGYKVVVFEKDIPQVEGILKELNELHLSDEELTKAALAAPLEE